MIDTVSSDSVAPDQIRAFVERIERLEEEIKAINDDKSEVYREAKANGFDVKVLRKIIADRRKDYSARMEFETLYELYAAALGMQAHPRDDANEYRPSRVHAREGDHETPAQGRSAPAYEPVKPEADAAGEPAGGDHESVTGDKLTLESETARFDDEAEIVDCETTSGEPTPLALGSDVEAVAPDPRAFVLKLRPHCLRPESCSGMGRNHCFACSVKINDDESEVA